MTKFGEGGYISMNRVPYWELGGHSSGNDFTDHNPPSIWLTLNNDEFRAWELSHIGLLETDLENNKDGLFF